MVLVQKYFFQLLFAWLSWLEYVTIRYIFLNVKKIEILKTTLKFWSQSDKNNNYYFTLISQYRFEVRKY